MIVASARRIPRVVPQTLQRLERRFGPRVAHAWVQALVGFRNEIDFDVLESAMASRNLDAIVAAIGPNRLSRQVIEALDGPLTGAVQSSGRAAAVGIKGLDFNADIANVILYARDRSATLVAGVIGEVRQAVRVTIASGVQRGLGTSQIARIIQQVVGLPPNQVHAPMHLAEALRAGELSRAVARTLTARDEAAIRSRLAAGTVDEPFIQRIVGSYSEGLIRRRANTIARTETMTALHYGQHEAWQQAVDQKVLPPNVRRFWVVTKDSRLSEEHAKIPSLNSKGRRLDEPFDCGEDGFHMYPPSRPNCRCSVVLQVP